MVNLATITFWKRKESSSNPETERIIPLPPLPGLSGNLAQSSSEGEVGKARDALKVLRLERQIIGTALATIFESEAKGTITATERVRLVDKYKGDLHQLEMAIEQHQRTVDLYDLEISRQELVKDFNNRMSELDQKMTRLRSGNLTTNIQAPNIAFKGPPPARKPTVTDAEKRVEQIRDEILKAMDRLEQIESEG